MHKVVIVLFIVLNAQISHSQLKKYYEIKNSEKVDTLDVYVSAQNGSCYFRTAKNIEMFSLFGDPDEQSYQPKVKETFHEKTEKISINLDHNQQDAFTRSISQNVFSSSTKAIHNYWKIYLSDQKVYKLHLKYGIEDANIDLSGVNVSHLSLEAGNSNLMIGYLGMGANMGLMDTFAVSVDMGSVDTRSLSLAHAKYVKAEIGFGKAVLDFSDSVTNQCDVKASVGAGKLVVILPNSTNPIRIKVIDSPLCGLSIPKNFEEVEENIFINKTYHSQPENQLNFEIDVALGNINFVYQYD